jgi:hypothetical protein
LLAFGPDDARCIPDCRVFQIALLPALIERTQMRRILLAGFLVWAANAALAAEPELRVGVAKVKITPPLGVPMAGYYHGRGAEGVHDELYAKALVMQQGEERVALVGLDVILIFGDRVREAREQIQKATGIAPDHVMISATHTHTGPDMGENAARYGDMGDANKLAQKFAQELPGRIAECVKMADASMKPARALAAVGQEPSLAFNRRFHMTDGSVGWNPGKGNPNIVKPAGPIDPAVSVVYFETLEKQPIGCYVNYSVHLDNVGGAMISADMPATLSRCLSEIKGPDFVTVYTTGCCGDVNHINVNWPDPQHGHENAARMGTVLAGDVLRLLPDLKPVDGALHARSETVAVPLAPITPDDVKKAKEIEAKSGSHDSTATSFMEAVKAFQVLDVARHEGKPIEAEVQVITLGNAVAWASIPGEPFVELGLQLKQESPFALTIVPELANDCIGYLPCRRAFPQGNYEVVSSRCGEGAGELIVKSAVRMLTDIFVKNGKPANK